MCVVSGGSCVGRGGEVRDGGEVDGRWGDASWVVVSPLGCFDYLVVWREGVVPPREKAFFRTGGVRDSRNPYR